MSEEGRERKIEFGKDETRTGGKGTKENEPFVEGRTCFPSTVTSAGYESRLNLCTRTFGLGTVAASIASEVSTMASSFATTEGGSAGGGGRDEEEVEGKPAVTQPGRALDSSPKRSSLRSPRQKFSMRE